MKRSLRLSLLIVLILIVSALACRQGGLDGATGQTPPAPQEAVLSFTVISQNGGRVSWSHSRNLIAFDKVGADGYYDVFTMNLNGSEITCLTCDKADLPQENIGQPEWSPDGQYIVFQAQDPTLEGYLNQGEIVNKYLSSPGAGINNNLWLMNADGTNSWQLTHVVSRSGVLHPHFSPDGNKLLWSEIDQPDTPRVGHWVIKLADFAIADGQPRLSNVQSLNPLDLQLYETHGFSPNGQEILFSGIPDGGYYYDLEIYKMDLSSGQVIRLTSNHEWDEHAHFTPDGRYIVWASSTNIPQTEGDNILNTHPLLDYWVMNPDGSDKHRLTHFNSPGYLESLVEKTTTADFDWGPEGYTAVAYLIQHPDAGRVNELNAVLSYDLP